MSRPHDVSGPQDDPVAGDAGVQSQVLEDLTEAVNYRRWQAELAMPHLGDDPLEIGSGNGDFAATLAGEGRRITASEAEPSRLAALHTRFDGDERVAVRAIAVPITETAQHTSVVAFNVLEHIPDDVGALRAFAGLVRDGGAVVVFVPAFSFAMSRFDRTIGHQRRYTSASLTAAMTDAGLRVRTVHYVNAIGLPTWVVGMRLLRMTPQSGPVLRIWDAHVMPRMQRLERRRTPPFGQSVFCVAEKVDD